MVMNILALSDLHHEFESIVDAKHFIGMLDPDGIDVVILAGDICVGRHAVIIMSMFCQRFPEATVIWVHGNHEYYLSDRDTVIGYTREALRQNKNLRWLDCDAVEVGSQRFIGATLWFSRDPLCSSLESALNDFRMIRDFRSWVYDENLRAMQFIERTVCPDDVVITHHLPSQMSIAERFKGSDMNAFFLCDMECLIRDKGPKLWVHGHTHDSFDYSIEHSSGQCATRVVCNPRGYVPDFLNPTFNPDLKIRV